MKIADLLSTDIKKQLTAVSGQDKREKDPLAKPREKYRCWEWEELMGQRRDTYAWVGGSLRRK
ncbi:hypothetical protein RG959_21205 [Domibacillus sp. 8LH]|uniref:hypothetical protein n=1 Tax=Domibacillus sp. 8LH TaxID=3073900 RepID=UPI00317F17AA